METRSGDSHQDNCRGLGWSHGALTVQRLGAMLAPLTFLLDGHRQISPLHIAPWAEEPGSEALPGILRRLRGDWPCVPFGAAVAVPDASARWAPSLAQRDAQDGDIHGYGSNHNWNWGPARAGQLSLWLDYPDTSPVRRLERTVVPDPDRPAVDLSLSVHVRRDCRLPIGLHPVFRLPLRAGSALLEPGAFSHGWTYPGTVEPGASLFAVDQRFTDLAQVPLRGGGTMDARCLPYTQAAEELLQLNGSPGECTLRCADEAYRVRLSWQKEHFPSLLLWISNRGRQAPPWAGRHLALGIEPVCSPFGLGLGTALADNPLAQSGVPTARQFRAGEVFSTHYRIELQPF